MKKILVTDYRQRHSQIIIKSLEKNYKVYSFTKKEKESKFFNILSISISSTNDIEQIVLTLIENNIYAIVPISISDYQFYSKYQDVLEDNNIKILISPFEIWSMLNDKNETASFANKIGVPIPKTIYLTEDNYIDEINKNLLYKVVIKSVNEGGARFVKYAENDNEAKVIIQDFVREKNNIFESGVIAQEYIDGESCAYFCISKKGKIFSEFGHKRIRENPPTGGVSTSCESFFNEKLFSYGRKIIKESKYSGVCMVEFKYVESRQEFYLIEVNPKFWGSILLSISSGIDFPNLYMQMLEDKEIMSTSFKEVKIQHVLSDFSRSIRYRIDFFKFLSDFFNKNIIKDMNYLGVYRYIKFYIGKKIYE